MRGINKFELLQIPSYIQRRHIETENELVVRHIFKFDF
jgi:hypothetical protein